MNLSITLLQFSLPSWNKCYWSLMLDASAHVWSQQYNTESIFIKELMLWWITQVLQKNNWYSSRFLAICQPAETCSMLQGTENATVERPDSADKISRKEVWLTMLVIIHSIKYGIWAASLNVSPSQIQGPCVHIVCPGFSGFLLPLKRCC